MYNNGLDIKRTYVPASRLIGLLIIAMLLNASWGFALSEEKEYEAAWQLCQAGKYPEAAEAYKKSLPRHAKGKFIPEARFTLARIETSGNNAFGHYQFILDNYPAHPLASQAAYATAQYLQNVGSAAQAKERYLFTYSRYGNTPAGKESLSKLALIALSGDSASKAEAYIDTYIEQYPSASGGAPLLYSLAAYWQKKNDPAKAKENWQKIIDSYPGSPESGLARENLIAALSQEGQNENSEMMPQEPDGDAGNNASQAAITAPEIQLQIPDQETLKFYYLQIGAYGNKTVMAGWAQKVGAGGFDTVVEEVKSGKDIVYKLQVGPYSTTTELKTAQQALKDKFGLKTMVVER